ncbi:MAG: flippase [Lachnospiraceae bacterium]
MNLIFFKEIKKNKILTNASWIIASRVIQAILGLIISMLTARYLGPDNFGLINYASSIVAFIVPIFHLGINAILVQEILSAQEKEGDILGTAISLNIFSALLCIIGIYTFVSIVNSGDKETILVCLLYSSILLVQSFELLQYWFQSKFLSKYIAFSGIIAYIAVSCYKVALLVLHKNIYWFSISNSLDYAILAICYTFLYYKLGAKPWKFSLKCAKDLLSKGKYYIISDLMVTIFAQTDKIMLTEMIGHTATGYYSAAVACAGVTQFIFGAILDTMRPVILESKALGKETYELNMTRLYGVIIYFSIIQSALVVVFANIIINILYGNTYMQAVPALKIIVWYTTFSYLGAARNIWILAEQKQKYLFPINFFGAVANVLLNLMFIPEFGICGAAFSSLLTQVFTNVGTGFFFKAIRRTNYLMYKSLNPKNLLAIFK